MKKVATGIFIIGFVLLSLNGFAEYKKEAVVEAQTKLSQKGFSSGPINGLFGPKAKKAIIEFQKKSNLAVTGGLEEATLIAPGIIVANDKPSWIKDGPGEETAYILASISNIDEVSVGVDPTKSVSAAQRFKQEFVGIVGPGFLAILLFLGIVLEIIFFLRKRYVESNNLKKGAGYYFCYYSLEFLVPFTIILGAYYALCGVLSYTIDSASLDFLVKLEQAFEKLRLTFSVFKLSTMQVLGALVLIYLLNFVRVLSSKTGALYKLFDRYQKNVRRAYIALVLLASFTLLGSQLGNPTSSLKVKIKTIRDGYADIVNETAQIVSQEVFPELFEKVKKSFPETYVRSFDMPVELHGDAEELKNYYREVSDNYGVKDDSVVRLYSRYLGPSYSAYFNQNTFYYFDRISVTGSDLEPAEKERIRRSVESRSGDINLVLLEKKGFSKKVIPVNYPGTLTYKKVDSAKKTISDYKQYRSPKAAELLKLPGGNKILLHGPKLVSSRLKTAVFGELIRNIPLLGPVLDVFSNTFDKVLEIKLSEKAENAFNFSDKDSSSYGSAIRRASSSIVQETAIQVTKEQMQYAGIEQAKLETHSENIRERKELLKAKAQQKRVELLLNKLKSAENDRSYFNSRNELLTIRPSLSDEKIREISLIENRRISSIIDGLEKSEGAKYRTEYDRLKLYEEFFSDQHRAKIKSIDNQKINVLITNLTNENEGVRELATTRLNRVAYRLNEPQVNRIIQVLNSDRTFKKYLYRESHCTWYEYITQKYYAGRVLAEIDSIYVGEGIKQKARNAVSGGRSKKRVMDPGWV